MIRVQENRVAGFDLKLCVRERSLKICEKAGISIYKLFRKEQRTEPVLERIRQGPPRGA